MASLELGDLEAPAANVVPVRRGPRLPQWLVEGLCVVVEWLLAMAILIPIVLVSLLSVVVLLARVIDVVGSLHFTEYVRGAVFGHLLDSCDQPLGGMLMTYWSVAFLRVTTLYFWLNCFEGGFLTTMSCCENETCRSLRVFLYSSLICLTVVFELLWPTTTFTLVLLATRCSWQLRLTTWALLGPYLLQVLGLMLWLLWLSCLQRLCRRTGLILDPRALVERFPAMPFGMENFTARGYPSTCAICLSDFTTADADLVLAPCHQGHVFHRSCLADWFERSQTCPLCRRPLHPAAEVELVERS